MSLSILNNIPSLEAQNQLATTNMNLQNTLFQLSSGSKINSGADDPAGLSIADGLQANISALTQSAQNVTDGVGMLQTADGALSQVTTLLNRAVTLATEAGNAGLTTDQQNALQTEYASITQEINQIGSNTTYNNNQVFTNNLTSVFLSDGSLTDSADPTISVTIPTLSATSLGLSSYATGTLDFTANPQAGNTVQIGQQTYTFATSATAAGEVTLGTGATALQTTLQNLKDAVNGTGNASAGTYGVGTSPNQSAQITLVNGGSVTVQSLAAGALGNNVQLATNLTSNVGASGPTLTGATDATNNNAILTLNSNPGTIGWATGSVSLVNNATPDILTAATGIVNFSAAGPQAGNATGTVNVGAAVADGDQVAVGGVTYTFRTTATTGTYQVGIGGSNTAAAQDLMDAINGKANANNFGVTAANTAVHATGLSGSTVTIGDLAINDNTVSITAPTGPAHFTVGQMSGGTTSDTITVGDQKFTFVAAGMAIDNTKNEVALGSSVNQTLQNLMAAVNATATGQFGTYSVAATNTKASMAMAPGSGATSATVTALAAGVGNGSSTGNSTALSATGTIGANFTAGTLAGGTNADTVTIGGDTYTFVAANQAQAGNNEVVVANTGNTTNDILTTLQNLEGAVNGSVTVNGTVTLAGANTWLASATNTQASITGISNGVATVKALVAGAGGPNASAGSTTGNFIGISTNSLANVSATAMNGGSNADTVGIGNVTYTFVAAGTQMTSGNQVALGTASGTQGTNGYVSAAQATLNNLMAAVNAQTASSGTTSNYFVTNLQGPAGATMTGVANAVAAKISALTGADIGLSAVFGGGDNTGGLSGLTTANLSGGAAAFGTSAASAATGMIDLAGGQPAINNATSTLTATGNVAAGDTVLVAGTTYTFTAASSATTNTVIMGSTLQQSLQHLQDAVNGVTGLGGQSYGTGTMTAAGTEVLSSFSTSGNTGTATFASTAIDGTGNGLALTYTNSGATTNVTSSGVTAGSSSTAKPDYITIGAQSYTFVAANAAVSGNEVALGVASGTAGTPTYISAVQATLNNLKAAVASQVVGGAPDAAFSLGAGNFQNAGTGASITSVNGDQAVVTSNLLGVGNGSSTGNSTVLSYTSAAATTNFAGSAAAGQAAGISQGTFTLTSNPSNGNTVTIGSQTYTFVSSAPTAAYQVYIGTNPKGTLTNLEAAVNASAGAGDTYGTGTVQNSAATITAVDDTTATLNSRGTGTTANSVGLSASISTGAAGGAVPTPTMLTGGSDTTNAKATGMLTLASTPQQGDTVTIGSTTYTFVTGTPSGTDSVAIGVASGSTSALEASMNNLMAAVNYGVGGNGAGAGTLYSGITQANTQASITAVNNGQATVQAVNGGSSGNKIALMIGNGQTLGGGGGSVDLSSSTDAQNALTVIAGAISSVASTRGAIGSSINQMNAAVQVMNNTSQNLTSSLSGIQDANIGQVVANMSKYQVLEQTGIAALTQANQQEQTVLKLLQ